MTARPPDPVLREGARRLVEGAVCGCGAPAVRMRGGRSASRGVWGWVVLHCGCGGPPGSVLLVRMVGGRVWVAVEVLEEGDRRALVASAATALEALVEVPDPFGGSS